MVFDFHHAEFVGAASSVEEFPVLKDGKGIILPEIAIVGRSNVGKSSLLNTLFKTRDLAKISKKPGKTKALYFYSSPPLVFVDLPGYGFAHVSGDLKEKWSDTLEEYFQKRVNLKLVLFLIDIRHSPSKADVAFFDWLTAKQQKALLVMTKADLATPSSRKQKAAAILESFGNPQIPHLAFSVSEPKTRSELIKQLASCLI